MIITALSPSYAHVSAAVAAAQDGDTVQIPAGTGTWTQTLDVPLNRSITIKGAGAISATNGGSSTTGSDVTTILDHHPAVGHSLFQFDIANGKRLRITGIKFAMDGSSVPTQNGVIKISGGANCVRIDHNHYAINPDGSMTIGVYGGVTGVIDHNYFDSELGNGPFAVYLQNGTGTGDAAWNAPDDFGTDKFIFIEDNRWRNGYLGDSNTGGQRFVYRYNTGVMQTDDANHTTGYVANHGITSGRNRSSRAFEYYGNVFSAVAPGLNKSPFPINGGTGLVWGNTISQYRYVTSLNYTRKDNATYPYGSPPSGWGNCNGSSGTVWDGSGGYPCLDQPGRGQGDLLSGSFPNIINTRTGNAAYVQQTLSPIYVWANTLDPAGYSGTPIVNFDSDVIHANRDFYQQFGANGESGSFDGTRGVGQGPLSARPSTCTVGVGYWATDTNTLYVCTATNTWTAYYTPYTYPHPLARIVELSGNISYCSNPSSTPVPGVTLTLSGDATGTTVSDALGNYVFSGLDPNGSYVVTPSKAPRAPGSSGIDTVDVLAILKHFLGIQPLLTGCALAAADVTGDAVVDTADVVATQFFFRGHSTGIGNAGKYKFDPVNRSYSPLGSSQINQDYNAIIFGDVANFVHRTGDAPVLPLAEARLGKHAISDIGVGADFSAEITPIGITAGDNLVGFQGDFTFDERVFAFEATPVQKTGLTAGDNWVVAASIIGDGPIKTLRVSGYSNDFTPLSGSGVLFELRMLRLSAEPGVVYDATPNNFIFIDSDLNSLSQPSSVASHLMIGLLLTPRNRDTFFGGANSQAIIDSIKASAEAGSESDTEMLMGIALTPRNRDTFFGGWNAQAIVDYVTENQ